MEAVSGALKFCLLATGEADAQERLVHGVGLQLVMAFCEAWALPCATAKPTNRHHNLLSLRVGNLTPRVLRASDRGTSLSFHTYREDVPFFCDFSFQRLHVPRTGAPNGLAIVKFTRGEFGEQLGEIVMQLVPFEFHQSSP